MRTLRRRLPTDSKSANHMLVGALRRGRATRCGRQWGLVLAACCLTHALAAQTIPPAGRPKPIAKEVFLRPDRGRPVATGFVTYVSKTKPVLMHCFGREDYSDGYDDYAIQISNDNGRTWSKPEIRWRSSVVPQGRMRYAEPAAYFDTDREKLIVLIDHTLYPKDKLNVDTDISVFTRTGRTVTW